MDDKVYGVKINGVGHLGNKGIFYLCNRPMPLKVLLHQLKTTSNPEVVSSHIDELKKDDLKSFQEEYGPLDCKFSLVESEYHINDKTELNKINIPFLHFHNADRAWKYMNEKDYNPQVNN